MVASGQQSLQEICLKTCDIHGVRQPPTILFGVLLQLRQGGVADGQERLVIFGLSESKGGAHRPPVEAHAGSEVPICGKGKVGLVCRGWYSGRIKADIFLFGLHIPIKAVQGIKSFGHSNLTEIQVTRNKGDIGGKFSANVLHKGGVLVSRAGR